MKNKSPTPETQRAKHGWLLLAVVVLCYFAAPYAGYGMHIKWWVPPPFFPFPFPVPVPVPVN